MRVYHGLNGVYKIENHGPILPKNRPPQTGENRPTNREKGIVGC